jgi:hypothetical protein
VFVDPGVLQWSIAVGCLARAWLLDGIGHLEYHRALPGFAACDLEHDEARVGAYCGNLKHCLRLPLPSSAIASL